MNLIGISNSIPGDAERLGLLLEKQGWKVVRYEDAVYQMASLALKIDAEELRKLTIQQSYLGDKWSYIREERFVSDDGIKIKPVKYYPTPKQILNKIEYMGREIHSNFWINALFSSKPPDEKWIVTDVDFPNEADAIKENDGYLIRLERSSKSAKKQQPDFLKSYPDFDLRIDSLGDEHALEILKSKCKWLT